MAGIYIHIPFCKKACHYCDFHFSTSLQLKEPLINALKQEIISRKEELQGERVETIYFGGGTPSILSTDETHEILDLIFLHYELEQKMEITLEANPDDLTHSKLKELRSSSVNRFSIGIQSFVEEDLQYMNRVHNTSVAERSIKASQDAGFSNLTIDLIYGTPTLSNENWINNLRKAVSFLVPHVSCYALTVEEKTPLAALIQSKKLPVVDDEKVADQFMILAETLSSQGYEHYEISNFAKPGFRSRHNSSYWRGLPYLGFGPSAHSYNGLHKRRWNISNNARYIQSIQENTKYFEEEVLDQTDRFNEFIMTRIRLIEGISLDEINVVFGKTYSDHLQNCIDSWNSEWYAVQNNTIMLSSKGKIISDNLASRLFLEKS